MSKFTGIYIPSVDAKDLYLANQNNNEFGYSLNGNDGRFNTKKFINTMDYSLELIKLRDVHKRLRKGKFSQFINDKEYSGMVINTTFEYSYKDWNQYYDTFVSMDTHINICEFVDGSYVEDGKLRAIAINKVIADPLSEGMLAPYFTYDAETKTYQRTQAKFKTILTRAELRKHLYSNGFMCNGEKYIRFKRSSGSSRVGKCLFIREDLYARMHKWELCGLDIKENDTTDLAAFESYISLTLSSIIDTVQIEKENILVIDDYISAFNDNVVETKDVDGLLTTSEVNKEIENDIWDGQSIGDVSLFGKYRQYGMILLRNRFFKTACFNCNIQEWFADNGITSIEQLNGVTYAKDIKDIKLITTRNNIKYLKFGTLNQWLDTLDPTFGIVKHEKPQHYYNGRMVQVHYQLLNSLQLTKQEVANLIKPETDHLKLMKNDTAVFRHHLKLTNKPYKNISISTQNEIIFQLLSLNDKFYQTRMCRNFMSKLFTSYKNRLRRGHILVNGTYATLFSNPMEMLQMSIGKFNGESSIKRKHVVNSFFDAGETIVGSRSPHISFSNVWVNKVQSHDDIKKYFNLTKEIICINNIKENNFNQLSGADCDGDTVLITNNKILTEAAVRNDGAFKIPTDAVSAIKVKRKYNNVDKASLDIKTSVNLIGEIINMSQILNSVYWHILNTKGKCDMLDDIYMDICTLDIMSRIEIDSAKKEFYVNNSKELDIIRSKYVDVLQDIGGMPHFFKVLYHMKGYKNTKTYFKYQTSMDFLQTEINSQLWGLGKYEDEPLNMSDIIYSHEFNIKKVNYRQIQAIKDLIKIYTYDIKSINDNTNIAGHLKTQFKNDKKIELINIICKLKMSVDTVYKLVEMIDSKDYKKYSNILLVLLFESSNKTFQRLLRVSQSVFEELIECEHGDIQIYDMYFEKRLPDNVNKARIIAEN